MDTCAEACLWTAPCSQLDPLYIMDSEVLYLHYFHSKLWSYNLSPLQWDHFIFSGFGRFFFFRKIKFGWFSPQRSLGMYVPLPLPSSSYHHCETNQNHICPKPLMALTILTQQFSLLLKPKICPAKLFEVYCNWKFILLVEGFHHFKFGLPFSSTIWSPNFNAWASSWNPKVAVVQGNRLKNKSTYKSTLELKLYLQNFLSLFLFKK